MCLFGLAGCSHCLHSSFLSNTQHTHTTHTLSSSHPNTIHLNFLLLISTPKWSWIRVGSQRKHLLVTSYAWIQESRRIAEVCSLRFGKKPENKVSGPHRTKIPEYISCLWLLETRSCIIFIFWLMYTHRCNLVYCA